MPNPHAGDLGRAVTHDADESWPMTIEIVAYWPDRHGHKGRRRALSIGADQFFGRGRFGAPMGGEQLIGMVDKLRRQGPSQ